MAEFTGATEVVVELLVREEGGAIGLLYKLLPKVLAFLLSILLLCESSDDDECTGGVRDREV